MYRWILPGRDGVLVGVHGAAGLADLEEELPMSARALKSWEKLEGDPEHRHREALREKLTKEVGALGAKAHFLCQFSASGCFEAFVCLYQAFWQRQ